uniref:Nal1 N-terminal domain-containing protein n=1 Tax=Manihot esculenta TaxID=3983 RepID=A0A2C9UA71_MANES
MDRNRLDLRLHHSGSTQSEESALDLERNCCNHPNPRWSSPTSLQPFASGGQHSESTAAYFSWPTLSRLNDTAEDRANYFGNLQKGVLPETLGRLPSGQRATTLLELMTIRAFHSKILRRFSLGTAIGFRIRRGALTDIPAILVFVARKVHRQWLNHVQCLPAALEGPGGVWCDVDVVEFSYYGAPAPTPKEQLYTELVDGLRGSDPCIGSGSQLFSLIEDSKVRMLIKGNGKCLG